MKKNLKRFLLLFVISISLINCVSVPEIIYRDPALIIPNEISPADLDDVAPITANEYKLMIQEYRWKLLYHEILKNAKKMSEEDYDKYVIDINSVIDLINIEIKKLEELLLIE